MAHGKLSCTAFPLQVAQSIWSVWQWEKKSFSVFSPLFWDSKPSSSLEKLTPCNVKNYKLGYSRWIWISHSWHQSWDQSETSKAATYEPSRKETGFVTQMPNYFLNEVFLMAILMPTGIFGTGRVKWICSQHTSVWLWAPSFTTGSSTRTSAVYIKTSFFQPLPNYSVQPQDITHHGTWMEKHYQTRDCTWKTWKQATPQDIRLPLLAGEPLHKSTPKERSRQSHSNMKMLFLCSGHSPVLCPEVLFPAPGDVYSTVHFFPSLCLFHCTVPPVLQSLRNVRH